MQSYHQKMKPAAEIQLIAINIVWKNSKKILINFIFACVREWVVRGGGLKDSFSMPLISKQYGLLIS